MTRVARLAAAAGMTVEAFVAFEREDDERMWLEVHDVHGAAYYLPDGDDVDEAQGALATRRRVA